MILKILKKLKNTLLFKNNNPYYNNPFGQKPLASRDEYFKIWQDAKKKDYPLIKQYENNLGYRLDKAWVDDLAFITQIVIKKSDICYEHGKILFSILCNMIEKNKLDVVNILETGTARGFSAICMARALDKMNIGGTIRTIDPLPHNKKMYWNCISDIDGKHTRKELLRNYSDLIAARIKFIEGNAENILQTLNINRVHFAFLDAMHSYEEVMLEFNYLFNRQKKGDMIIFDDYTKSLYPEVIKAVDEICENYPYHKKVILVSNQRGYAITTRKKD